MELKNIIILTFIFLTISFVIASPNQPNDNTVGYQYLDDTIHIWNEYNDYYFNSTSAIQLTNHYDDYWTRNVLCFAYKTNEWNYHCTDNLPIKLTPSTDNNTYVSLEGSRQVTVANKTVNLSLTYYLEEGDQDLTITPSIENLGSEITNDLGFAWKITDIQISMTEENDYARIDSGEFTLHNSSLDETYNDLDNSNITLFDTVTDQYLYLTWNNNLNYALKIKDNNNYNADSILLIKFSGLQENQTKSTDFQWLDAPTCSVVWNVETNSSYTNFSDGANMKVKGEIQGSGCDRPICPPEDPTAYFKCTAWNQLENGTWEYINGSITENGKECFSPHQNATGYDLVDVWFDLPHDNKVNVSICYCGTNDQGCGECLTSDFSDWICLNTTNQMRVQEWDNENTPSAENITISPSSPNSTENLILSYDFSDLDGDSEDTSKREIKWYINGNYNSSFDNQTNISSQYTLPGQKWGAKIKVFDNVFETGNEQSSNSNNVTIEGGGISIRDDMILLINGEPFFPIGMYMLASVYSGDGNRNCYDCEDGYSILKENGFNLVIQIGSKVQTYTHVTNPGPELHDLEDCLALKEYTERENLYFMGGDHFYLEYQENIENIYEECLSNSTTFLGYHTNDEPVWFYEDELYECTDYYGDDKPWLPPNYTDFINISANIKNIDSDRLIMTNFAPADGPRCEPALWDNLTEWIEKRQAWSEGIDIVGVDIHPKSNHPCCENCGDAEKWCVLVNPEISVVGDFVDLLVENVTNRSKPIWMMLTHKAATEVDNSTYPETTNPNWTEKRFMYYQSIIHGATGVKFMTWKYDRAESIYWRDSKRLARELSNMTDIFVETSEKNYSLNKSGTTGIDHFGREHNGDYYIVSVNRENFSKTASFEIENYSIAEVLFEDGRYVPIEAGTLTDQFIGFDTHIYKLTSGDEYDPHVKLVSPPEKYVSESTEVSFNCSCTDDSNLTDVKLYIGTHQQISLNSTAILTGKQDSHTFTLDLVPGNYIWNCLATDDEGNKAFGIRNHSLTIQDGCVPPAEGDWIIDEECILSDEEINFEGGKIIISNNGILNLTRVNFTFIEPYTFNYSSPYINITSGINVTSGGEIIIQNSNITSSNKTKPFSFAVEEDGKIFMKNSSLSHCGIDEQKMGHKGLEIKGEITSFENNRLTDNYYALVTHREGGKIINSVFNNNIRGVSIMVDAVNTNLSGNTFENNEEYGIYVEQYKNYIDQKNKVNDETIHYYYNVSGTPENNIQITNLNLGESNTTNFAKLVLIDVYNANVTNCTFSNGFRGITLRRVYNSSFSDISIESIKNAGVYMKSSESNDLNKLNINKTGTTGIHIETSKENNISYNNISNLNNHGIFLIDNSTNNEISKNKIKNAMVNSGISIFLNCKNNQFIENEILGANQNGYAIGEEENYFWNNTFEGETLHYYYNVHGTENELIRIKENQILEKTEITDQSKITLHNCSYLNLVNFTAYNATGVTVNILNSHNLSLENTTLNSTLRGMRLENSKDNTFRNLNIYGASDTGIKIFDSSTNNTFYNAHIENAGTGISFNESTRSAINNNYLYDSSFVNCDLDINSEDSGGDNGLINSSFTQINVQNAGKVFVNWWLDFYVNDTNGIPLGNANVTAYQINGSRVFSTLTGQEHTIGNKLFLAHFNNNNLTADGEAPSTDSGTSYETAQLNEGIYIDSSDNLEYSTTDNLDLESGSIEFWVKPNWNGNDSGKYLFFCMESDADDGGMRFGKFYNGVHDYLYFNFIGSLSGSESFCEANTYHLEPLLEDWTADQWHHLVGTWNSTSESIKLYIDGEFVTEWNNTLQPECNWNNHPEDLGESMSIGMHCNTSLNKQANSTMDEFAIYDYPLTASEVLEHYRMAGKIIRDDVVEYALDQSMEPIYWSPYTFNITKTGYDNELEEGIQITESIELSTSLTPT